MKHSRRNSSTKYVPPHSPALVLGQPVTAILFARFNEDEPVEVWRGTKTMPWIKDDSVRGILAEFGKQWTYWFEYRWPRRQSFIR